MADYSNLENDLKLIGFRRFHFSNSSGEERFRELGHEIIDYRAIHLSIAVPDDIEDANRRHNIRELKLAQQANKLNCAEVTNIDYGSTIYSALGWIEKEDIS